MKGSYSNNRLIIHDHKSIKIITFKFYLTPRTKENDSIYKLDSRMSIAPDFAVSVLSGLCLDKR